MGIIYYYKDYPALFLIVFHKNHLMFMDICKGKSIFCTFLCIKTDRNTLNRPNIVNSTFLIKICQRDLMTALVDVDRCASVICVWSAFILIGVIGVGIFCTMQRPCSIYSSFVLFISSSSVEPRSPLDVQVISSPCKNLPEV